MRSFTRSVLLVPLLVVAGSLAATTTVCTAGSLEWLVETESRRLAAQQIEPPQVFEVSSYRFGGGDATGGERAELEPVEVDGPNASGIVRLRFRVLVAGARTGEVRATVRGVVRAPAVVATAPLKRGQPIDPRALAVQEVDVTRVRDERPLYELQEIGERVPIRTLGVGQVLTAELLEAQPVIRRGDVVDLKVVRRRFTITATAKAFGDGAPGEVIPVANAATGARFLGEVQRDGSVIVVRRDSR